MIINGLILAAGNSSRLGQPKQLVKFQGRTLLADIETKLLDCCDQVYVVLGYKPELFRNELSAAKIINNLNWQAGMGNSLACGARVAGKKSNGLLIALSDQPKIDTYHYQKLVNQFTQTPDRIITTAYQNHSGVPVIFPNQYMKYLTQHNLESGAQAVIQKYPNQVINIECQAASYDVDSVDDLSRLDNSSVG